MSDSEFLYDCKFSCLSLYTKNIGYKMLSRVFGAKKEEIIGVIKLHMKEFHNLHSYLTF
jgi:hypothetical protein